MSLINVGEPFTMISHKRRTTKRLLYSFENHVLKNVYRVLSCTANAKGTYDLLVQEVKLSTDAT